jgi:5-formyltetrahydrofolate cyclo-ligase
VSGPTADDKAALRARLRGRRRQREAAALAAAGVALAEHAHALRAAAVAGFVGVRGEPPTLPLLDALRDHGTRVLLPRLLHDMDLEWVEYAGSDALRDGPRGLLEPVGPALGAAAIAGAEVVLVPALAVDRRGHRLGQGGGSYDRALPRTHGLRIAVVFADEVLEAVPVEPHDAVVDGVLTEHGLERFRP